MTTTRGADCASLPAAILAGWAALFGAITADSANSMASATDAAAVAGVPVDAAAASRSAMGVARGLWIGAKMTRSKIGKRIWAREITRNLPEFL